MGNIYECIYQQMRYHFFNDKGLVTNMQIYADIIADGRYHGFFFYIGVQVCFNAPKKVSLISIQAHTMLVTSIEYSP